MLRISAMLRTAYTFVAQHLTPGIKRALVILGSGQNDEAILDVHLKQDWRDHRIPFADVGINAPTKAGHAGTFVLSKWDGVPVVVSQGRLHSYQVPNDPRQLRHWMTAGLVLMNGSQRVIVHNAVGGLNRYMIEGSIALPTQFIASHFRCDGYVDGWSDGHPAPEALLPQEGSPFNHLARRYAAEVELPVSQHVARYIVVSGPRFGGAGERSLFGEVFGCDTVGMSLLPELDLVAVENMMRAPEERIRLGSIQVVTDNKDHPTDAGVVDVARQAAPKVAQLIGKLLNDPNW